MNKLIIHLDGGLVSGISKIGDGTIGTAVIVDTNVEEDDIYDDSEDTNVEEDNIYDDSEDTIVTKITNEKGQQIRAHIHEEIVCQAYNKDLFHLVQTYFDNKDIDETLGLNFRQKPRLKDLQNLPLLLPKMRTPEGRDRITKLLKG